MGLAEKETAIQKRIQKAFEESGYSEKDSDDISFHMTDWLQDIDDLQRVYSNIDKLSNNEITSFIYKFVAHVPNHLNAAMKLTGIGPVADVFETNIFEDEEWNYIQQPDISSPRPHRGTRYLDYHLELFHRLFENIFLKTIKYLIT